jgi:hypothetical protein
MVVLDAAYVKPIYFGGKMRQMTTKPWRGCQLLHVFPHSEECYHGLAEFKNLPEFRHRTRSKNAKSGQTKPLSLAIKKLATLS